MIGFRELVEMTLKRDGGSNCAGVFLRDDFQLSQLSLGLKFMLTYDY